MKCIDQFIPTISYGDAVSNDTIAIKKIIQEMGYKSDIYAINHDPKLAKMVKGFNKYKPDRSKIIIYHKSMGTDLSYKIAKLNLKKIMIYHNITPARYFEIYNRHIYNLARKGRDQLKNLNKSFDYNIADSEFNRQELENYGYKNIDVLPILIPFSDYEKKPEQKLLNKFNDRKINILFVGRIAPNKKQEDVIKTFYYYKKYINKNSRLFLVGSSKGMEKYFELLKKYVKVLELDDVYFCGHVPFSEILAYYRIADVFLCMSEHEGFCVPLIESMYFDLPILAFKATAVPYTLDNAGVLFTQKKYHLIAEMINELVTNNTFRYKVIKNQRKRLDYFSYDNVKKLYKQKLSKIISR